MLSPARTILYSIVIFCSFLSFVLSAAFIGRTNSDFNVYNPGSAAVLASTLFILLTLPVTHFLFHRRGSNNILASVLVELILLGVLWVILLGSAAAMSDQLPGLGYCRGSICSLGRAVQAFAWLAWIALTFLLGLVATLAILSATNHEEAMWTRPLNLTHVKPIGRHSKDAHATTTEAKGVSNAPVGQTNAPTMSSA